MSTSSLCPLSNVNFRVRKRPAPRLAALIGMPPVVARLTAPPGATLIGWKPSTCRPVWPTPSMLVTLIGLLSSLLAKAVMSVPEPGCAETMNALRTSTVALRLVVPPATS
jgi:hypothetical protein